MTGGGTSVPAPEGRAGASRLVVVGLRAVLGVYRGWSATRLPRCRYLPSCSAYADEAIAVHGAGRGLWLALRRVLRCRPGGGMGYDPVPEPRSTQEGTVPPGGAAGGVKDETEEARVG